MSKFAERYYTVYETVEGMNGEVLSSKDLNGKEFIVIDEVDKHSYDYEDVGVMYIIEFDGGLLVEAFADEVLEGLQVKSADL